MREREREILFSNDLPIFGGKNEYIINPRVHVTSLMIKVLFYWLDHAGILVILRSKGMFGQPRLWLVSGGREPAKGGRKLAILAGKPLSPVRLVESIWASSSRSKLVQSVWLIPSQIILCNLIHFIL